MKRTPLKRKTPLKRGPLRRKSKSVTDIACEVVRTHPFTPAFKQMTGRTSHAKKLGMLQPTALQRRTWLKAEGDRHKIDREIYNIQRKQFLKDNPLCQLNVTCGRSVTPRNIPGVYQQEAARRATQIHHTCGRGKYYLVVETWKGTCWPCHEWENSNRNKAVELGLRERVRKYERDDRTW